MTNSYGQQNARSDFGTVTQYTPEHLAVIPYLLKASPAISYLCEDGAVILCSLDGEDHAHYPDILAWANFPQLPVFIDGSIHERERVKKRDITSNDHLVRLGYKEPLRITNEEVKENTGKQADRIISGARE